MSARNFRKQFGSPERETDPSSVLRRWQYVNDGLDVFVTPEDGIAQFTLYLVPSATYRAARAAQTDTGIAAGASD
jgi:hypothetical protein